MFYKTLTIFLAVTMGFMIYDLYTILENQEEMFCVIHKLRGDSTYKPLLTR